MITREQVLRSGPAGICVALICGALAFGVTASAIAHGLAALLPGLAILALRNVRRRMIRAEVRKERELQDALAMDRRPSNDNRVEARARVVKFVRPRTP